MAAKDEPPPVDDNGPAFPFMRCKAARFNAKGKMSGEYDDLLIPLGAIGLIKDAKEAGHIEIHNHNERIFVVKGSLDEFYA